MQSNAFTLSAWHGDSRLDHMIELASARLGLSFDRSAAAGADKGFGHFRRLRVPVTATHPGGGVATYQDVIIGSSGTHSIVLHPGYLHPGTEGRMRLPTVWGASEESVFAVRDCQHLEAHLHVLNIEHVPSLDLSKHVKDFRTPERVIAAAESKTSLSGRALIIEPHQIDADIVLAFLGSTQMTAQACTDMPQALASLRQQSAQVVIADAGLEPGETAGVRKIIRQAGHTRAVLLTAGDANLVRDADQPIGQIDGLIIKPFDEPSFFEALVPLLAAAERPWKPGELRSRLSGDPRFEQCLVKYREFLAAGRGRIVRAMKEDDVTEVRGQCRRIHETGKAYGYDRLSQLALDGAKAIDATGGITEALGQLDHLIAALDELSGSRSAASALAA